jgi:hypothetical protein
LLTDTVARVSYDSLSPGVTYYWRCRARASDPADSSEWSSAINFGLGVLLKANVSIHAYPNPFRLAEGHPNMTFTNLPQNSQIKIATLSGNIVLDKSNIGPGDWAWDVKSDDGQNLASGVYLYTVDFPSGSSGGKVVVIR